MKKLGIVFNISAQKIYCDFPTPDLHWAWKGMAATVSITMDMKTLDKQSATILDSIKEMI